MCRVLEISKSGFYDWLNRPLSLKAQEDEQLKIAIRAAHKRGRGVYGPKRLQEELAAEGYVVGRDRIDRLRKEMGIQCKQKKKFKVTTNSNHLLPVAENLLNQDFTTTTPNH
uniref:HTH-like domain-containing protein n=1 Tax=Magnetococcus massalia (strain MO-1) TaxID=451514 RepID=A0A1S7LL98_MAGMO|nr:Conserved protein of unknown function [Candidatus Magnetococcus massalia]